MTTSPRVNRVADVLIQALQNGVLSLREARQLVAVALEELRNAERPELVLRAVDPVIRAALHLQLARSTREFLERFAERALEVVAARSRDDAPSIDLESPELRARVQAALAHAIGNAGVFTITDLRRDDDELWVELLVMATPVRVRLAPTGDGAETVASVALDDPELLDPEIVASLEAVLKDRLFTRPLSVRAYAGRPSAGGVQWTVTIREGAALRALTLAVAEDGTAALGGYSYEPNEARAMAGQLALAHALGLAAQAGPLAQLEVLVRASMRTPTRSRWSPRRTHRPALTATTRSSG